MAAAPVRDAGRVFPLFFAGRTARRCGKGIPNVPAGTLPICAAVGFPAALGAFDFEVVGHGYDVESFISESSISSLVSFTSSAEGSVFCS